MRHNFEFIVVKLTYFIISCFCSLAKYLLGTLFLWLLDFCDIPVFIRGVFLIIITLSQRIDERTSWDVIIRTFVLISCCLLLLFLKIFIVFTAVGINQIFVVKFFIILLIFPLLPLKLNQGFILDVFFEFFF